jgi:iron complex outermembrane recepter protein
MQARHMRGAKSRARISRVLKSRLRVPAGCFPPVVAAFVVMIPAYSSAQEATIEQIVVTAQRREQSMQNVPISISAFSSEMIEKNMFEDITDYITQTPNASFVSNGARSRREVSIRGVSSFGGGSSTLGFYVDDFSVSGSTINPPIMDIERIEILRGPQATYFGRNALGGGISITSKKPDNYMFSSLMMDYSRFNTIDLEGTLNVPIIEDRLAARFNFKHAASDGNIRNIHPTGGGNDFEYQYAKSAFRYTPTDNLGVGARGHARRCSLRRLFDICRKFPLSRRVSGS